MRTRTASFLVASLALLSTCKGGGGFQLGQVSPAAQRPTLQEVRTSKATMTPKSGMTYDVLPASAVRIAFQIPTFTELDVYQNGTLLTRASTTPGTPIAAGTYAGDVVTNTQTTADWAITLRTANFNASRAWISIRNRSVNPDFIGKQRVSDPLHVCSFDGNVVMGCGPVPFLPAPPPAAAGVAFTQGVDCLCSTTGAYAAPVAARDLVAVTGATLMGNSPNNVYRVEFSSFTGGTVEIVRLAGMASLFRETFNGTDVRYAFSADDARFAYSFTSGGNRVTRLYNLSVGGVPRQLERTSSAATPFFAGFSPSGKYFVYASATGVSSGTAFVDVINPLNGVVVYQSNGFSFSSPVTTLNTPFRTVAIGFSPLGERTLAYWNWTASGMGQWTVVNLATPRVVLTTGFSGVSSVGLFSPCGDVLAIISQAATQSQVTGFRTRDGQTVGSLKFNSAAAPSGQCTTTEQRITIGGTTLPLANNTANETC